MKRTMHHLLLASSALVSVGLAQAHANPLGSQVIGGSAAVQGQGTKTVTVTQSTDKAIINWNTFNIGAGETTRFVQPSSTSVTLNRVTGALGPSQIDGSLTANGRVFLVNPDGILFGKGSVLDTAGFLATTNDIKNADFMAGRYNFSTPGNPSASIVNQGTITARDSGFAALVAPGVRNSGTITATLGTVGLASGNGFSLDLYGDKLINLSLSDSVTTAVKDVATGQTLDALVKNEGTLKANGGRVELTAAAARTVVDSVINTTGVIEANSLGQRNGMIVLGAATAASKPTDAPTQAVKVSGKLSAAGKRKGTTGGAIQVTGEAISVTNATLDASGRVGGGTVLVGGDTGGGNPNPMVIGIAKAKLASWSIPTATTVNVDANTWINVSAKQSGDGGKVVVWSDYATSFAGFISATGGLRSGNGGFAEVSGHQTLNFSGSANQWAPNGSSGALLLDPAGVTVLFQGLGFLPGDNQSVASAVSADGTTVVGFSGFFQGFRWTQAGGMVAVLGPGTLAGGVSGDGSVVVGSPALGGSSALLWTQAGGTIPLGTLGANGSNAFGVSTDGTVAVGDVFNNGSNFQAFRWTQAGGMVGLGFVPGSSVSAAFGTNANGSVVVGYSGSDSSGAPGTQQAFRWTVGTGMVGLGFLAGGNLSQAAAVNSDGSVVVGQSNFAGGLSGTSMQPFRWTQTGGMVGLGFLPGANYALAEGVSENGSTIVGYSSDRSGGGSGVNEQAYQWTSGAGLQSIQGLLQTAGITLPGRNLIEATGVSANGATIVGRGTDPLGRMEAFIVSFPSPPPTPTPPPITVQPLLPPGTSPFLPTHPPFLTPPSKTPVAGSTPPVLPTIPTSSPPPTTTPASYTPPPSLINEIKTAYASSPGDINIIAQDAQYAQLANAAYADPSNAAATLSGKAAKEWKVIGGESTIDGMSATVFQNGRTGEVVVSFRGTINNNLDVATDTQLVLGVNINNIPEMKDALAYAQSIQKVYGNVTFTGHSLGGAMAQYAATEIKTSRAIAFDAMPLAPSLLAAKANVGSMADLKAQAALEPDVFASMQIAAKLAIQLPQYQNITNFRGANDPVSLILAPLSGVATGTVAPEVGGSAIIVRNTATAPVSAEASQAAVALLKSHNLSPLTDVNGALYFNHSPALLAKAMNEVQLVEKFLPGGQ